MKPTAFDYFAPTSLEEALDLKAEHGEEAKPLAGGQSLIPTMNFRVSQPSILVDLNGIDDLRFIRAKRGCTQTPTLDLGNGAKHRPPANSQPGDFWGKFGSCRSGF